MPRHRVDRLLLTPVPFGRSRVEKPTHLSNTLGRDPGLGSRAKEERRPWSALASTPNRKALFHPRRVASIHQRCGSVAEGTKQPPGPRSVHAARGIVDDNLPRGVNPTSREEVGQGGQARQGMTPVLSGGCAGEIRQQIHELRAWEMGGKVGVATRLRGEQIVAAVQQDPGRILKVQENCPGFDQSGETFIVHSGEHSEAWQACQSRPSPLAGGDIPGMIVRGEPERSEEPIADSEQIPVCPARQARQFDTPMRSSPAPNVL